MTPTIALVLLMLRAARADAGPPAEIAGTWEVEHVRVDNEDAPRWAFTPDDPQLVGRTLLISAERVQFEEGKDIGCAQPTWKPRPTTWGALFRGGFGRAPRGGGRANVIPTDYDTKVSRGGTVAAYVLCPPANGGRERFPKGHWVALQGPGQLLLHLDEQTLLVLRRREAKAPPKASFECPRATTATEIAICGSHNLASWDRSVAAAFRQAIDRGSPDEVARLREEQRAWLHERDACRADTACIDDHQWRRVKELTHP